MAKTITAANAVITLQANAVFPVPVQLQGFAAENIFETGDVTNTEGVIGVDGRASYGWVAAMTPFSVSLMPDSDSNSVFESIYAYQQTNRDTAIITLGVRLKSIGRTYVLTRGALMGQTPIPTANRVLQARRYPMMFEKLTLAPI